MISVLSSTMPVVEPGEIHSSGQHSFETFDADHNAAGSDPNCGAAFDAAIDDTTFGLARGCSQTNPTNPVAVPTVTPVCG